MELKLIIMKEIIHLNDLLIVPYGIETELRITLFLNLTFF